VAQEEKLMMIRASITIGASLSAMVAASLGSSVWQPVDLAREERKTMHIHEEKVFVQLEEKEDRDSKVWICDTGATNHMPRSWEKEDRDSKVWICAHS
jgi:hypothetical protein